MFEKPQKQFKRAAKLFGVLNKYGLIELFSKIPKSEIAIPKDTAPDPVIIKDLNIYVRVRMALEELGPTYVKLGQAFANREDLLPKELCFELQKLQDNVPPADIDTFPYLSAKLGIDTSEHFKWIDEKPLASASIAQVYKAQLMSGEMVVLKVKRPGIQPVIEDDLLLIKNISSLLEKYVEQARRIHLVHAINAFEKSLMLEISFLNEKSNYERFSKNHKGDKEIYIPKTYDNYSNNDILCIEYIDGAKITDLETLKSWGISPPQLAQRGLDAYLKQILEHGFFHADPHAGNIFVLKDGRICFIDLGSMGIILPNDQENIESFIMYFLAKNVPKIIQVLKDMAISVDIPNERKLEQDIYEMLNLIDSLSLEQLDVYIILDRFKHVMNENDVLMPEYVYLLVRGIMLIDSIGRTINPKMNIIDSIKPYFNKIIKNRLDYKYVMPKLIQFADDMRGFVANVPKDIQSVIKKANEGNLHINLKEEDSLAIKNKSNAIYAIALSIVMLVFGLLMIAAQQYTYIYKLLGIEILAYIPLGLLMITFLQILKLNPYRKWKKK